MNWLFFLAAAASTLTGLTWDRGFGESPLWADGNAEVSIYDAKDVKYGAARESRAVLIVVAEDLRRDLLVKADRPEGEPRTRRVLKLNHVRSIQTGVYRYEQMLSLFLGARLLEPVKLTVTSHEWCGNTFVEWREDTRTLSIRSYFESVGDRDVSLAADGRLFYDELPLKLRALDPERAQTARLDVIESVFSNNPRAPGVSPGTLTLTPGAGATYRVDLERGVGRDLFEFEREFPRRLRRWERSDGGLLTLVESRRTRYWKQHDPGDEKRLPADRAR